MPADVQTSIKKEVCVLGGIDRGFGSDLRPRVSGWVYKCCGVKMRSRSQTSMDGGVRGGREVFLFETMTFVASGRGGS